MTVEVWEKWKQAFESERARADKLRREVAVLKERLRRTEETAVQELERRTLAEAEASRLRGELSDNALRLQGLADATAVASLPRTKCDDQVPRPGQ